MLREGITILIAFSGILFGLLLTKVTENEIKPGKQYIVWIMKIMLLILVVCLIYYSLVSYWIVISFLLGFVTAWFFRIRYFYLGLALVSSLFISLEIFLVVTALIFVYGIAFGALLKDKKKIILELVLFLIPFLIFFFPNISDYSYFILSFTAGSLFLRR